jgi:hypothetical protein
MALNKSSINSRAVNNTVADGTSSTGGGVVVSIAQAVKALGTGIVVSVAQNVGKLAAAAIRVSIQQEVELKSVSTPGIVVSIAQAVKSTASKTIDVEQSVVVLSDPTSFYGRNGYEPMLYIGGVRVPTDEIHDLIEVTYTENDAPQLRFTLIPPTGVQDIRGYRGKVVIYKIREASGISHIFSGKINTPDVTILDQKIRFNCSLDIEQTVQNTMGRAELDKVGYYNTEVFSNPETNLQELKDRVSTIPSVINFRKTGVPNVDPIASAASPHYTLTDSDVYRRDLNLKLGSGQRYINKVNLKVTYSYQRLHHHERTFIAGTEPRTACEFLLGYYDPLTRALVSAAVQGSGWALKGDIAYDDIWASGWYTCSASVSGSTVGWSTVAVTKQVVDVLDGDGNPVTVDGVQQKEVVRTGVTDYTDTLCNGAQWIATTRFTQNIKTEYTLSIEAPQSQSQNGVKEKDLHFNLASSYEAAEWENYNSYTTNTPLPTTGTATGGYWIDADTNKTTFDDSVTIMLNKAKSDILKSHREDRVMFKRSLWTTVDLWHTIKLNCTKLVATGRVYTFTHSINASTGEAYTSVELSMSQSTGSATDSSLSLPATLTSTPVYQQGSVQLGNGHYGLDPATTSGSEAWTGHIANKKLTGGTKSQHAVSFVVDTPDIGASLRNESVLTSSTSYDVEIPNDALTINFDQWT